MDWVESLSERLASAAGVSVINGEMAGGKQTVGGGGEGRRKERPAVTWRLNGRNFLN